jgi:hypothetical protein
MLFIFNNSFDRILSPDSRRASGIRGAGNTKEPETEDRRYRSEVVPSSHFRGTQFKEETHKTCYAGEK